MKYLKVFTDFAEDIEQLSDVEVGRLFRAMLQYAEKETVPDLKGNERFLWPNAKRNIDNASQMYDELSVSRSAAGKKGAKKRWQTDSKNSKCHFANGKNGYDKDKDKEKDKENISSLRSEINSPPPPLGGEEEQKCADETKLDAAIAAFVEFRKGVKKPMTDYAVKLLREKLDKMAASEDEKVAIVEQSIVNGWQGVFPLKDAQQTGGNVFLDIAREEGIL